MASIEEINKLFLQSKENEQAVNPSKLIPEDQKVLLH